MRAVVLIAVACSFTSACDGPSCPNGRVGVALCPGQSDEFEAVATEDGFVLPIPLCLPNQFLCSPSGRPLLPRPGDIETYGSCGSEYFAEAPSDPPACLDPPTANPTCVEVPCDGVVRVTRTDGTLEEASPRPTCEGGDALPRCGAFEALALVTRRDDFLSSFHPESEARVAAVCGRVVMSDCDLTGSEPFLASCVDREPRCADGTLPFCVTFACGDDNFF